MANETSTFSGATTRDLEPNAEQNITIPLEISDLQLLIPDNFGENPRLIQIDDIEGNGWKTKNIADYTGLDTNEFLLLTDLDYDQYGRVYTISFNSDTNQHFIRRFNSHGELDSSFKVSPPTDSSVTFYINTLCIDRVNEYIYFEYDGFEYDEETLEYIFYHSIKRVDYNGENPVTYDVSSYVQFDVMDVDENGYLYAGTYDQTSEQYGLVKFEISTDGNSSTPMTSVPFYGTFRDISIKGDNVYVLGQGSFDTTQLQSAARQKLNGYQGEEMLIRFSLDLTEHTSLTGNPGQTTSSFAGAYLFIPTVSKSLYIYDNDISINGDGRIIKVDNIDGDGWTEFRASDIGKTDFDFLPGYT
jgi:hypothetical protein